ncbi:hypothetical protein LDH20_17355, partial [Mycobacterium tuberculosis]
QQEGVLDLK